MKCFQQLVIVSLVLPWAALASAPPQDFPTFTVPGHEREMASLRELFWLHYPGASPKATLWDEWLPDAALWPAVESDSYSERMRQQWRDVLSARVIDPEGYVATHQHASIAHQQGWPFPFWNQGRRGCGWHFSFKNTAPEGWRPHDLCKPDGWKLANARAIDVNEDGWRLEVAPAGSNAMSSAIITAPPWKCHTFEVPFLQLRWQYSGLGAMQPFIEWTTPSATNFSVTRRMYFDPPKADQMNYTMVPMYRHPEWTGEVAQLRIGLGNSSAGAVTIQAFFSQYDTRHNINGQNFIRGCAKYFWWTRDLNFLRTNLNRMRMALHYLMTEHQAEARKVIYTPWVGHTGRSGIKFNAQGKKEILTGEGIGNNYWDLLPFGSQDAYATVQYYDAVLALEEIEAEVQQHPEWEMPGGALHFDADYLKRHAVEVKKAGNQKFWDHKAGRFVACVDEDGKTHDYGFTFLNCEAIYYDFATPQHAKSIMTWMNGDRVIPGDTSQGVDIYHWRFGPRSTTKRNVDWYFWVWNDPGSIPWGGQVQDGGAVLGFSYHDLMSRLKILGPDNAWKRLQEIVKWLQDVDAEGGYRKYYNGSREGTMQGSGAAGGLGLDMEFFESVLVPQIMLRGFLGFVPRADGFVLNPQLPSDWPSFTVNQLRYHNLTLEIQASRNQIEIRPRGQSVEPVYVYLEHGKWSSSSIIDDHRRETGKFALWEYRRSKLPKDRFLLDLNQTSIRFTRTARR